MFIASTLLAGLLAACSGDDPSTSQTTMKLKLTSPAFAEGQPIPTRYIYNEENVSPALQWADVPLSAKSLALICDDPDAPMGTWVHWVICDLPPNLTGLSENVPKLAQLANGAKQGMNDYKQIGYGGPCPPPGKPHRYFFKLYALDGMLSLKPGLTKADLTRAMSGHILAEGQLMGTYQTKP